MMSRRKKYGYLSVCKNSCLSHITPRPLQCNPRQFGRGVFARACCVGRGAFSDKLTRFRRRILGTRHIAGAAAAWVVINAPCGGGGWTYLLMCKWAVEPLLPSPAVMA